MTEPTSFLYPFIDADERDADSLVADLAESARRKAAESRSLGLATLEQASATIDAAAAAMATAFGRGGRLFTFGNGGSATDAEAAAERFGRAPGALAAISLVDDHAVLTALANDVGFDVVFARQLGALARTGDIAMGFSTSGSSSNVLAAFAEARRRGLVTVGFSGYDGGTMARTDTVQHCLVVSSDSVHRVQETQARLLDRLWSRVHAHLAREGATP